MAWVGVNSLNTPRVEGVSTQRPPVGSSGSGCGIGPELPILATGPARDVAGRAATTMATEQMEHRDKPRYELLEFGMIWRPTGPVPERVGPGMITNASIGGVQFKTREELAPNEAILLELGSAEDPLFLPCEIRYAEHRDGENRILTVGVRFNPKTRAEQKAVAKYMLSVKDRVCATG